MMRKISYVHTVTHIFCVTVTKFSQSQFCNDMKILRHRYFGTQKSPVLPSRIIRGFMVFETAMFLYTVVVVAVDRDNTSRHVLGLHCRHVLAKKLLVCILHHVCVLFNESNFLVLVGDKDQNLVRIAHLALVVRPEKSLRERLHADSLRFFNKFLTKNFLLSRRHFCCLTFRRNQKLV